MINILFVSHYSDLKMGGQQSMLALIKALDTSKFNPMLVCPDDNQELAHTMQSLGFKTFEVPLTSLKPKNLVQNLKNILMIRKIIKNNHIDIIHPDHERDSIIAGLARIRTKCKMIWHVRLTRGVSTDKLSAKLATVIIGIAEDIKQRFQNVKDIDKKYTTIFNGVDCEVFKPTNKIKALRTELSFPKDSFLICFVGQYKLGKGILDIIESIIILKEKTEKQFKLIMIGSIIEKHTFEKMLDLISSHHLEEYVEILSQQKNIYRYMQAADLLILPSHEATEGMGRVLFESMSCGTPVIGTNVKGVREAITPETGILVDEKSPESIAQAIEKFMNDDEFRIAAGRAGRERALNYFDIKIHAKNVSNLYHKYVDSF